MMDPESGAVPAQEAEKWQKYEYYDVETDPKQDDKATEIRLCSFARPHMRAFHCSWWSFFIAFFVWFSISPLLSQIRDDLNITNKQVWTSSITGVAGTIAVRFMLGPACDKYGARVLFSLVLCFAAIPTACTGLVKSALGLALLRLFIGVVGGTFVMCQYWTSRMFTKEVAGTANALVGGWGNLGAGVTQIVIGSLLFPLMTAILNDKERAWRTVSIIPAVFAFATGVIVYFISDDAPKGNYWELRKHGSMEKVSMMTSFYHGGKNMNTWHLFIQYACCFGVELTMNNATALYFADVFGQSTESAAAIASIFGWMNLFARGMGGFYSDYYNAQYGMQGRLWVQTGLLLGEGISVLIFSNTRTLAASVLCMILFSLFVQAAEGATYGIVPYVDPEFSGTVCGIVGAGGNVGAVTFGLTFRQLGADYRKAFLIMGCSILASAFLSIFIRIEGQTTFFSDIEYYPDIDYDGDAYPSTSGGLPKEDGSTEDYDDAGNGSGESGHSLGRTSWPRNASGRNNMMT